jgi:hypothetical protein
MTGAHLNGIKRMKGLKINAESFHDGNSYICDYEMLKQVQSDADDMSGN